MFSLGGLDENGKNMFIIEIDKNIFVFEAGLKYADEMTLGIDYIIPNISYLKENNCIDLNSNIIFCNNRLWFEINNLFF